MLFSIDYIATIINSTIRMMSPLLYASLAAAICAKADIFNLSMEGAMLVSAFFSIVVNYFTKSVVLSILAGVMASVLVSDCVGFFVLKLKASPVVVGLSINNTVAGATTYLLYIIFNTRGVFTHPSLVGIPKIRLPFIEKTAVLSTIFSGLTLLDYMSFVIAILVYLFFYKTVIGYRIRAIGINSEAARSLGTPVEKYQFLTISFSGILCGFAGCLLSMGSVRLFIENITAGRGYIAMAANHLGKSHPIGVLFASLFFGCCQALGNFLQNTSLKTQITSSIPYVATILALIVFTVQKRYAKQKKMLEVFNKDAASS